MVNRSLTGQVHLQVDKIVTLAYYCTWTHASIYDSLSQERVKAIERTIAFVGMSTESIVLSIAVDVQCFLPCFSRHR